MQETELNSCIYEGKVWHRRVSPKIHAFSYNVAMVYLDLGEVEQVFSKTRSWGFAKWRPVSFQRENYFGDSALPLDESVRDRVAKEAGFRPDGKIGLLTNLRYFGYITNPISCYYCFDKANKLVAMLLDVTNTPWDESLAYVLDLREQSADATKRSQFQKSLHVSPFMPMSMQYRWAGSEPATQLTYTLKNYKLDADQDDGANPALWFTAGVDFIRQPLTKHSMRRLVWRYPAMTVQVIIGIYWQALKLFVKRIPLFAHPNRGAGISQGRPDPVGAVSDRALSNERILEK